MSMLTRSAAVLAAAVAIGAPAALVAPAAHAAGPVTGADGSVSLTLEPRAQEKNQWCWIGSGSTVAAYLGKSVSQNEFCNRASGLPIGGDCPNEPGTLSQVQRAYRSLGISPGTYRYGQTSFTQLRTEVDSDRPSLARIGWRSGGGHVLVLHGYRAADRSVMWMDPWPSNKRLNVSKYSWLQSNDASTWTHSLTEIGGWR